MNLIFIYGPPATGKLTIANELSSLTGLPVFHNHLTRDIVKSLYPENLQENYGLVNVLREDVFEYCALHNTSLIFTFVYSGEEDDIIVAEMIEKITDNGGEVLIVELTAPNATLLERVANESRKKHMKLVDPETLASILRTSAFHSVPYENIYKIDTSVIDPANAAKLIQQHFKLA